MRVAPLRRTFTSRRRPAWAMFLLALAVGYLWSPVGATGIVAAPVRATEEDPDTPASVPSLTLDEIFPPRDLAALRLDPSRLRVLIATGDVIPARRVDAQIRERDDDFLFPVAETADVLRAADLTFVNLEAPLIPDCPLHRQGFVFCGRPGFVEALVHAGVDVAGLENNHIGNYDGHGVRATRELLKEHQIDYTDRGTLAIREVRDLRFGFLAFNGVGSAFNRQAVALAIQEARPQVDVLVVAVHWGAEYMSLPRPAPGIAPDDPVEIAHLAVGAGADLIIGNHPHWVQAVELYEGRLIAYAHGNFIFDQMWSLPTRQGVVGRYTFYDDRLVRAEFLPILIEDSAQPRFLAPEEGDPIVEGMQLASHALAERLAAPADSTMAAMSRPGSAGVSPAVLRPLLVGSPLSPPRCPVHLLLHRLTEHLDLVRHQQPRR